MKKNYKVNKFLTHQLENSEIVVQNMQGIIKIHNEVLIDLILDWDLKSIKRVSYEILLEKFSEYTDEAIEFLTSNGILIEEKEKTINIKRISVVTNDDFIQELLLRALSVDYGDDLEIHRSSDEHNIQLINEKDQLTIVFLNPYSKKFALNIRDHFKGNNTSYLLMSYIYHNMFYMDCLYNYDWHTPCHGCHMGHLETQMRVGKASNLTYQQLIDLIYSEDEDFPIGFPLKELQKLKIATEILERVNMFIHDFRTSLIHPEDINKTIVLNLENYSRVEDTSIHWELCDCYE